MIPRDAAATLLQPLAAPTITAFATARNHSQEAQAATTEGRGLCSSVTLGLIDGVSFWGFFAGALVANYGKVATVARMVTRHPLTHAWLVSDTLCVRMRSDIAGVNVEQLMLPGIEALEQTAPDLIAPTWEHAGPERFGPTFVHVTPTGQAWRIPVASLLEQATIPMPIAPPAPKLTSSRPKRVDDAHDAAGDSQ